MENLNITNLTANVNNIQALSDRPNTADGITSQELKERFDKAGADIKDWANNSLIVELEDYINRLKSLVTNIESLVNGLDDRVDTLDASKVNNNDERLTNSRTCNNSFDSWSTSRSNLKITYGTSLPGSADDGSIFFLY